MLYDWEGNRRSSVALVMRHIPTDSRPKKETNTLSTQTTLLYIWGMAFWTFRLLFIVIFIHQISQGRYETHQTYVQKKNIGKNIDPQP